MCWNILALIQHVECTTVQSLNSQHLPCCKYSMAPCVASTTPLSTCKHAQKKVMQVNAKQDSGVYISDHLRLKCCLKSKNHLYRPQPVPCLSPTQLLASLLSPGLWQPGRCAGAMSWQPLQLCKSMVKLGSSTGHWSNTCESSEAVAWSTSVGRKSFRKTGQNSPASFKQFSFSGCKYSSPSCLPAQHLV